MVDLPNLANLDYVAKVNRAIDHVVGNLRESHRLPDVARIAGFSPYHFHRIFKSLVGETLAAFIKRVRLERALYLLSHRQGISLTEVALACGFSSSSDFSRNFRAHYGVPPRVFDLETFRANRRQDMQAALTDPTERHHLARLSPGDNPDGFSVALRSLPARRVAYIRVHRPYQGDGVKNAAQRLVTWAHARGLAEGQWLGYQWDDPEIVPLDKCRYDLGVEVPATTQGQEAVSTKDFAPMRIAEIELSGGVDLAQRALDWLFGTWLPSSGFAPDHQPCFEAFAGEPFADGDSHFELRVQLPIVDATRPL